MKSESDECGCQACTVENYVPIKADPTEAILSERAKTHGDYTVQAATGTTLRNVMERLNGWQNLTPVQSDALIMISVKISRILTGAANTEDHWRDIAGYATLVADRCK